MINFIVISIEHWMCLIVLRQLLYTLITTIPHCITFLFNHTLSELRNNKDNIVGVIPIYQRYAILNNSKQRMDASVYKSPRLLSNVNRSRSGITLRLRRTQDGRKTLIGRLRLNGTGNRDKLKRE